MDIRRDRLVRQIEDEVRLTARELGFDRLAPEIAEAIRQVPRHRFVPAAERGLAYIDHPLPIGGGQTISQPYIVAVMSQLLDVHPGDRVFELGTGSGYQAAVLDALGVEVYSIEIVPELAQRSTATLAELGCERVHVRAGDGWFGWPEAAPFDGVIVTAASPIVPEPLLEQLTPKGRLVIPMGSTRGIQHLAIFTRDPQGRFVRSDLLPVRFVPVTGNLGGIDRA